MQLYISPTSPYARKAWMMVLEKGLADEVEVIPVNPWESPPELTAQTPLCQVPVLVIGHDQALYDSRVICAYVDSLSEVTPLIPQRGMKRMIVLRMEALADGMSDVAVATFFARKDNGDNPDTPAIERQLKKIAEVLKVMEAEISNFEGKLNLGTIAYGASLAYLDLRYSELQWRRQVPKLAAWFETIAQRPAMLTTAPPA
ncbi:MAG: glutathione S-transferase family protein [bacterium]|nr:glutathione S-transferase family protein [bacterium]